jgi:hypothetical protein
MNNAHVLNTLHALRHAPGLLGSFLWMDDGRLVAADVTPGRPPAVLQLVTRRLASIATAYASAGQCLEHVTLVYDQYQLHISGLANASLVVVLTRACSLPTVLPVIDDVLRELSRTPELGLAPLTPVAPTTPFNEPERVQPEAARSYRGGRILE